MSRYATWADVSNRYSVEVPKVSGGQANVKESYINGAEALVDATCALRYVVPFTPVPELIKDLVIDLAYLKLVIRQDPKSTQGLRDATKAVLDGLACGSLTLTMSGSSLAAGEVAWSTHQDYGSSFGVDDPINWQVSSGWQNYFAESRA